MSLKAKLEAVIYAAEEPVTLAQLAALFAADALDWKTEQEAARTEAEAEAAADTAEAASGSLPFLEEGGGATLQPDLGSDSAPHPDSSAQPAPPVTEAEGPMEIPIEIPVLIPAPVSAPIPALVPALENADGDSPAIAPDIDLGLGGEPAGELAPTEDPEAEARRLAKLRDREVRAILRQMLDELIEACAADNRGVEIREIAGGYRMATKPECHDAVRSFVKSLKPALKLSLPALETLAVVAYKQPVTAPEVNEIRGVDSSGVFGSLLARKLIATAGRKQVIGRPILYKTTREFLLRFGLKDVSELPSMEEFEKMAAIELEDTEDAAAEAADREPMGPEDTAPAIESDLNRELSEPAGEEDAKTPEGAPELERPAVQAASSIPTETAPGGAE
jgi:segregation and condensation protein B